MHVCDNLSKEAVIRAQHEEFKQEAETVGEKDSNHILHEGMLY